MEEKGREFVVAALPEYILKILTTLESEGEAYLVGGCIRDCLLCRPVHDWDICTSLPPERVRVLFPHTVPTGIRHGTITVLQDGKAVEVTTYRTDGAYLDHRRPETVSFGSSLEEDLERRDFTVNAMAMDRRGMIVDLFGGQEDLERRLLRCVGDPMARFSEDALRIFRAVRFAAQLGFSIEPETKRALQACSVFCESLSAERVRDEVEKILCSERPEKIGSLSKLGVLRRFGLFSEAPWQMLRDVPPERAVRWAMLYRLSPRLSLRALRLDRDTIRLCEGAYRCRGDLQNPVSIKKHLAALGASPVLCAAEIEGSRASVEKVLSSGECITLRDLSVGGTDFPGVRGPALGALLQALLSHVWEHPSHNTRDFLLRYAEKVCRKTE